MTLPTSLRRLLSWLRLGRSPQQQVRSRVDVPVTFTAGVAAVPDPPADLDRFEKTSRIDPAAQRAVPVAPDDKFGPAAAPRGPAVVPDPPPADGNGDVFDRNSGGHHRRLP